MSQLSFCIPWYTYSSDNDVVSITRSKINYQPGNRDTVIYKTRKNDGHVKEYLEMIRNGFIWMHTKELIKEYACLTEFYKEHKSDDELCKIIKEIVQKFNLPFDPSV